MSKSEMFAELRKMMNQLLAARARGASHPRLSRAQGYVDGYMRALLESGQASQEEILSLVAAERAAFGGPATRVIEPAASC